VAGLLVSFARKARSFLEKATPATTGTDFDVCAAVEVAAVRSFRRLFARVVPPQSSPFKIVLERERERRVLGACAWR